MARSPRRIGVTLRAAPGFILALGYDAELRANATSHTIQARLKLGWQNPIPARLKHIVIPTGASRSYG